ncbi:MAG TPA: hypothetical protein VGI63_07055, partial [Verrucomicrobiae bacterium]
AWFGVKLVRGIESRKSQVNRSSEFIKKWADTFFDTSQKFMMSTERYMSILHQLQGMTDPNCSFGTKLQKELNSLNVELGELGLRINRLAFYAPTRGIEVVNTQRKVQEYLTEIVKTMQGSFDHLKTLQNNFNRAVREAHSEMLELG